MALTSRLLPQVVWQGEQATPPSSQPSAHSWLPRPHQPYLTPAYLHDVFLGAGDRASLICPALFCPAGSPCWAHPGKPASKSPAQQGPGDAWGPVLPSAGVWGLTCAGLSGDSAELWAAAYIPHGLCTIPKPCCSHFCLGVPSRNKLSRSRVRLGNWEPPHLHPSTLSSNGKVTRTLFLRGFLSLRGSPRERHCTDI